MSVARTLAGGLARPALHARPKLPHSGDHNHDHRQGPGGPSGVAAHPRYGCGAVIDQIQAEIVAATVRAASGHTAPEDAIVAGTRAFLLASTEGGRRRIVLTDGPAVLGWSKWRELDEKHFGNLLRFSLKGAMGPQADEARLQATCHMLLGAITEAALVCGSGQKSRAAVERYMPVFERLLHAALANCQNRLEVGMLVTYHAMQQGRTA